MTENTTTNTAASGAAQGKPDITYKKYKALLDETCTPLAECAPVAPTQHIVLSDEQIKAHGDRASGMMTRDMTRFDAACEVMKYLKEQGAPYYYIYRMSIVLHGNYEGTEVARAPDKAAPVAPAPQPAPMPYPTDAQIDAVYEQTMSQHLRSQDAPAVRRFGRAMFLYAWNAAAPKTDPAINKVNNIIDAYGMTPGQPERVADIPGLAEALEAAFADGSAQVTGALQQGEYLPLPVPDTHCYDEDTGMDVWSYSASQMHAAIDADRAARGAAQAAPAEDDKWRSLALQFDSHRMQALSHLKLLLECGEDHADAVRTFLAGPPLDGESVLAQRIAAYAQPAPASWELVAEVMFDERKYIQYTIPLELLPVGAKFYTAQEARVPLTLDQRADIHESLKYEGPDGWEADWGDVIDAVEKHHGITAAQKETPCAPTP